MTDRVRPHLTLRIASRYERHVVSVRTQRIVQLRSDRAIGIVKDIDSLLKATVGQERYRLLSSTRQQSRRGCKEENIAVVASTLRLGSVPANTAVM